jgi:hypothetical protein
LLLGLAHLERRATLEASGWFLIALCTVFFAVVDSLGGFVLPVVAQSGMAAGFLVAKSLFDILFMLGTATFGLGAAMAVARDLVAPGRTVPRLVVVLALASGIAALAGGVGGILGFNLAPLMGFGILGGAIAYGLVGVRLVARPGFVR